jgi:hypothetical protein
VSSALYLDFDNVFSGLLAQAPAIAMKFAEDPGGWLDSLAKGFTGDKPRRWLVLRCYLNPAGAVQHPCLRKKRLLSQRSDHISPAQDLRLLTVHDSAPPKTQRISGSS